MSKHKFTFQQKFAVWKFYGPQCYWCGEPLRLQETTIDHLVPEYLLENKDEYCKVARLYGLSADFKINSYSNWIPCHSHCNSSKNDRILTPTPMIQAILEKLIRNEKELEIIEQRISRDAKKDKILAKIMVALENEEISKEEIDEIFIGAETSSDEDIHTLYQEVKTHLDPKWKVVHLSGNIATVTNGKFAGATPISDHPDSSWLCPNCGFYGPWNGVRCMTCGQISDPND